ncbi:MAG: ATP-binding protein, partial [Clostridium sp.]
VSLNTVVITGENGSGKTRVLKMIAEALEANLNNIKIVDAGIIAIDIAVCIVTLELNEVEPGKLQVNGEHIYFDKIGLKFAYLPSIIDFGKMKEAKTNYKFMPMYTNIVEKHITENIPSLITTKIYQRMFQYRNKVIGEVIDEVCDEINDVFKYIDLKVHLKEISSGNELVPLFENSKGKTFDINSLSAGEKQLYLRALALYFLDINDSIILIDEPELSLHPKWQKSIMKVYENIGYNNQLIVATHSPFIEGEINISLDE